MTILDKVNIETETVEVDIFTKTKAGLAKLHEKYGEFPDPSESKEAYEEVKAGAKELTGLRTTIEKMRKEVKQPYLDAGRIIDAQAKYIIDEIVKLEGPMKEAKKLVDEKEKREKEARLKRLESRIDEMRQSELDARGQPSEVIEEIIEQVEAVDPNDFYELHDKALKVKMETLDLLSATYTERLDYERTARKREEERKEREEQDRKTAIQERINKCKMIPLDYMGKSANSIRAVIEKVKGLDVSEDQFQEFTKYAVQAKETTLKQLNAMLEQQKKQEALEPKEERDNPELKQVREELDAPEQDKELARKSSGVGTAPKEPVKEDHGNIVYLTEYQKGYLDCLKEYAYWKDGVEYVGSCGITLEKAAADFLASNKKEG